MIDKYFYDGEVKEDFSKEYVSLWKGWLGREEIHKLSEVTLKDWQNFNNFLKVLYENFDLYKVNLETESCTKVENPERIIDSYELSQHKDGTSFTKVIIPELEIVYTEEWD